MVLQYEYCELAETVLPEQQIEPGEEVIVVERVAGPPVLGSYHKSVWVEHEQRSSATIAMQ